MIKEFFEIGKEAPEKIHIDITDKDMPNRGDLYDSIIRAVTSAFYRLFNTKELYKITVDIRLEKRFTKTKKEENTVDDKAESKTDGIKAEEKSGTIETPISNNQNNQSGASKYHNGYSDNKKKE